MFGYCTDRFVATGMWLVREGVRVEYAEDVHKVTHSPGGDALSLLCPTRHILSRGDTLNLSTLTIVFTCTFFMKYNSEVLTLIGH